MDISQRKALECNRKAIVDYVVLTKKGDDFLSYLHNEEDDAIINDETKIFLQSNMNCVSDTIHMTLDILKSNDNGWSGLTDYLAKYDDAVNLADKLKEKASETAKPVEMEPSTGSSHCVDDKKPGTSKGAPYPNRWKGMALLINNENFTVAELKRVGSRKDLANLVDLWEVLKYRVVRHVDLTGQEMEEAVNEFANNRLQDSVDSAVAVVMSHGNLKEIEGIDGQKANVQQLIYLMQESPLLLGKPKLFLFQNSTEGCNSFIVVVSQFLSCGPAEEEINAKILQRDFSLFKAAQLLHDCSENSVKCSETLLAFGKSRISSRPRRGTKVFGRMKTSGSVTSHTEDICKMFAKIHVTSHNVADTRNETGIEGSQKITDNCAQILRYSDSLGSWEIFI